ncbi:DUF126 domain-containing protein [Aquisalimonas lutea]|uniref:aconitase X swivel domain-containing protein n=1 Tax=Aquisalimonas lutea TaxID=1327750 RepID=UPI0025B61AB7|nr:DUF126 domain-containing protein [Aquisalimonas lutea]MDN3519796.1 DUF126 domain-containing protein [Aquisalimonas lutea]
MTNDATHTIFYIAQATDSLIEAPALVDPLPFSARYDLNRKTGAFSRQSHPLFGKKINGYILVSPGVQGGVAAGWALPAMANLGVGFSGLIFGEINPVMVQGAVAAGIPIASGVDSKIFDSIKTGDILQLDGARRTIKVL